MADGLEIHGSCETRFDAVRDAFAANFADGAEVGASFAAFVEGRLAVDLWGGFADAACTRAWQRDTLVNVYSTTKAMAAVSTLLLADRGEIDLEDRVAAIWPEFAARGKGEVRVRHLLAHTAGVPGWETTIGVETLYDWERSVALLAEQAPWWEPGTRGGYHAFSQGHLLGEVVRRATGRTLGELYRSEIAAPLGVDFHIGLPREHDARVAEMVPPVGRKLGDDLGQAPDSISARALGNPAMTGDIANTRAWRTAEIPAANGQGNARSVARIAGALANGGSLDGKRLLGEATVARILEPQCAGDDLVLGVPIRWGLGFAVSSPEAPVGPHPRTFFWGGWGGSLILVDLDARVGLAYAMNKMGDTTIGDTRAFGPAFALFAALAEP